MPSSLEKKFRLYWQGVRGPELVPEFRFCQGRLFRFDFASPETKVGIELEGGIWTGGRHTRGAGYESDCEKHRLASYNGWLLFRFTKSQITVPELERLAWFINNRLEAQARRAAIA
jgi:very-short-patch-repair endonuclease